MYTHPPPVELRRIHGRSSICNLNHISSLLNSKLTRLYTSTYILGQYNAFSLCNILGVGNLGVAVKRGWGVSVCNILGAGNLGVAVKRGWGFSVCNILGAGNLGVAVKREGG
jgi:hypothetical protein